MPVRNGKWHPPPPPPSPRILHLPRRSRRTRTATKLIPSAKPPPAVPQPEIRRNPCGRLGELLEQEQWFESPRRGSVEPDSPDGGGNAGESAGEKWRIQAETLRAECNFLRMERGVALKKLERNRVQMDMALWSAVGTLVSGRRKIDGSESVGMVLKEDTEELEELQGRRRSGSWFETRDLELRSGCGGNFDKNTLILGKRLKEMKIREKMPQQKLKEQHSEKYDDEDKETYVREIREIAADTSGSEVPEKEHCGQFHDVDMLRRKIEGISKGMLERVEEYGFILSSSPPAAARGRDRTQAEEGWCTGRCREVVRKIVEQVRAETEQWPEMQRMLEQVREEMEDLRCSRDFWERCAVNSDAKLRTLNTQVMEWRQRAEDSEHNASMLQKQVCELQIELDELRGELFHPQASSSSSLSSLRTRPDYTWSLDPPRSRGRRQQQQQQQRSQDSQRDKEKRVLICRLNESSKSNLNLPRRSPLHEIGNLSLLFR